MERCKTRGSKTQGRGNRTLNSPAAKRREPAAFVVGNRGEPRETSSARGINLSNVFVSTTSDGMQMKRGPEHNADLSCQCNVAYLY